VHTTTHYRDDILFGSKTVHYMFVCTSQVLKCGAGEVWRRSVGPICVRHEEVLHRVKEERNIVHTIKRRKATWICHILRRNCLLNHVTEWEIRIEVTGRRGRRRKQLQDDLKEKRGYWKLKQEALDRTLWLRICRKTHNRMNYLHTP
jgi:hypothetical protein